MVFLGGPRQVGKTTLARSLLTSEKGYFNWDNPAHRSAILSGQLDMARGLVVLDEIHKYRSWRNLVKGLYDVAKSRLRILVTGSARLDLYRYGGDSLQGRYHFLRLHPLSYAELGGSAKTLADLMKYGGFPEPFLAQNEIDARRWSLEYRTRLIRDDLVAVETVRDLGNIELLMLRLPELVGSPLSINGLREDLRLNHATVANWLEIFERLYAIFRLAPFGSPKIKAVKKERKHYHYDWTLVEDEAYRFENLIACHLLKWANHRYDVLGEECELNYFREVTGRETDFVVTKARKPILFVECKLSDAPVDPALAHLKVKFPDVDAWQVSLKGKKDYITPAGIRVAPAIHLLKTLV